jgi:4'-phosphopantetheinyl transferase
MAHCLEPGVVHLWYRLTEGLGERDLLAALEVLSPIERERYERFVFERDRRDFAAAHGLLRNALSTYGDARPADWTFVTSPTGKPLLGGSGSKVEFNISHTHGLVACAATADVEVGVDVESLDSGRVPNDVVKSSFSEFEIADLDVRIGIDRLERFVELWTLKEAYLKAIGVGLSGRLNAITFEFDGSSGLRFHPGDGTPGTEWQFALFAPSVRHRMAVAVHSRLASDFRVLTWSNGPADASLRVVRKSSTAR